MRSPTRRTVLVSTATTFVGLALFAAALQPNRVLLAQQTPRPVAPPNLNGTYTIPRYALGVSVENAIIQDQNGVSYGVLIDCVYGGGPAADLGLEPGDIITRLNNERVQSMSDLTRLINGSDGTVTVRVKDWRTHQYLDRGPVRLMAPPQNIPGNNRP